MTESKHESGPKESSFDSLSFDEMNLVLEYLSDFPEDAEKYSATIEKEFKVKQNPFGNLTFWRNYLNPKIKHIDSVSQDPKALKALYDQNPEYRIPSCWPRLQGEAAIKFYQSVLKEDPDNLDAISGLAFWIAEAGRRNITDPDVPEFKTELDEDDEGPPGSANSHVLLDRTINATGKAINTISKVLTRNPNANNFYYLGRLAEKYFFSSSSSLVPKKTEELKKTTLSTAEDLLLLEQSRYGPNDSHHAYELWRKALELDPLHPETNCYLADRCRGNLSTHQYHRRPEDDDSWSTLCKAQAIGYRRALEKDPIYVDALYGLASAIHQGTTRAKASDFFGKPMPTTMLEQCEMLYEQIVQINPGHERTIDLAKNIKKSKEARELLLQIPAHKWPPELRSQLSRRNFETLQPRQKWRIFREINSTDYECSTQHSVRFEHNWLHRQTYWGKKQDSWVAWLIVVCGWAGGSYGTYRLSIERGFFNNPADTAISFLGVGATILLPILLGTFWYLAQVLQKNALRSLRQELIIERVIAEMNHWSPLKRNAIHRLKIIPNNKWPSGLKARVINYYSERQDHEFTPEAKSIAETYVERGYYPPRNDQDHKKMAIANLIEQLSPGFFILGVVGSGIYGIYETSCLEITKTSMGFAIFFELIAMGIIALIGSWVISELMENSVSDYMVHSIDDDKLITQLNGAFNNQAN